jgi:hypothetical protein
MMFEQTPLRVCFNRRTVNVGIVDAGVRFQTTYVLISMESQTLADAFLNDQGCAPSGTINRQEKIIKELPDSKQA